METDRYAAEGAPVKSTAPITALIVDDERLARERLHVLLQGEPDMLVLGECANGLEAIATVSSDRPELVFLDVHMPDLDGLGVIAALGPDEMPEVIFVTAHNAYMERAFEVHAVDYLRKPYTNARFASALSHARRRVHARRAERSGAATAGGEGRGGGSIYATVAAEVHESHPDPRLALQDAANGTWHIVDREEIDWIQADGSSRVRVHIGADAYVWRRTLADLESSLDPRIFLRVHRSYLVNASRIRHVKPLQRGEYALVLADGRTILDSGRTYRDVIERFLRERTRGA